MDARFNVKIYEGVNKRNPKDYRDFRLFGAVNFNVTRDDTTGIYTLELKEKYDEVYIDDKGNHTDLICDPILIKLNRKDGFKVYVESRRTGKTTYNLEVFAD